MGNKKNIDRLFQERFKDFEVTPNDAVWDKIEKELNKKKKKHNVFPIWWRYAGVAAALLLFFTVGVLYFNSKKETVTQQVVDINNNDTINVKQDAPSIKKEEVQLNNLTSQDKGIEIANDQGQNNPKNSTSLHVKTTETGVKSNKKSSSVATSNKGKETIEQLNQLPVLKQRENKLKPLIVDSKSSTATLKTTEGEPVNKHIKNEEPPLNSNSKVIIEDKILKESNDKTLIANKKDAFKDIEKKVKVVEEETVEKVVENKEEKQAIEDAIAQNESLLEEESVDNSNKKWSVAPNVAPVYFSSIGEGSTIGSQFNNNSKSGEVNMSYGINASYAVNNRLSIRSGINRVNLAYNTNDILSFKAPTISSRAVALSNVVNRNKVEGLESADGAVSFVSASAFTDDTPSTFETSSTSVNQSFGFIEIPLEIQYAISNKRLGVNVIGGFSSFLLVESDLSSRSEGQTVTIDDRANVNKASYSANIGLGLNYKISKKINLNLEPMFKYQINTFNNTSGDFQPFFLGVYTGFGIKF